MSECRQFNMLCGSQSKFVQVKQFFFIDLSLTIDDLLDLQSVTFILQNVVVNLF